MQSGELTRTMQEGEAAEDTEGGDWEEDVQVEERRVREGNHKCSPTHPRD